MSALLFSTTILVAFVGGVLALLAPCCISVMLPAYFASTFRRRTQIVGMTLVFAAGVGTVILPIALGATALSRLLLGQHAWVFGIGGLLMVVAGVAMLAGKTFSIPMMGRTASGGGGMRNVYGLGVFSGGASACCAPVLVGVAAVAGATASFPVALLIGVVYVFGMVAPLAVIALVWDRKDWGSTSFLRDRRVGVFPGRKIALSAAISGALMVLMGVLTAALAISGQAMVTSGWQVRVTAWLQHLSSVVLDGLSWLPGWASAALVFGALALFVWAGTRRAHRGMGAEPASSLGAATGTDPAAAAEADPCTTSTESATADGAHPTAPSQEMPTR